jgi:nucleoid-associated protein YgaU
MRLHRIVVPLAMAAALAEPAAPLAAQTLRGSRGSVERMYGQAKRQDLTFYRSARGIRSAAAEGELVRLRGNADYRVAGASYAYGLPTTRTFVQRLARQYRAECGERLVVTSATRPKAMRLRNSVTETVHPTGMAVDLRKPARGSCLRWLRQTLLEVEGEGVIDAIEERRPPHFHVAVFPRQYAAYVEGRTGTRKRASLASSEGKRPARRPSVRATYRVREGDSLWTIARRHGVSVTRLKEANGLRSSRLAVGQKIVIPRGS